MRKRMTVILIASVLFTLLISPSLAAEATRTGDFIVSVAFHNRDAADTVKTDAVDVVLTPQMRQQIGLLLSDSSAAIPCAAVNPDTGKTIPGIRCEPMASIAANRITISVTKSCAADAFCLYPILGDDTGAEQIQYDFLFGEYQITRSIRPDTTVIRMKDDRVVHIVGGRVGAITVDFSGEVLAGSTGTITLTNAFFDTGAFFDADHPVELPGCISGITIEGAADAGFPEGENETITPAQNQATLTFRSNLDGAYTDSFSLTLPLYIPISYGARDSATLSLSGSAFPNNDTPLTVVSIIRPFDVTFDQVTLPTGAHDQAAGNIVITETDKGMLSKGKILFALSAEGFSWGNNVSIDVTGDLKRTDIEVTRMGTITLSLKRQSKAASTITVSQHTITVDRTVPEGLYKLLLSGGAIDQRGGSY